MPELLKKLTKDVTSAAAFHNVCRYLLSGEVSGIFCFLNFYKSEWTTKRNTLLQYFIDEIHKKSISQDLNGKFLVVYTSAPLVNCQRITYVIDSNGITTGHVESPYCCLEVNGFNFNSNQLDYTIGPISGFTNSCPTTVPTDGSMKLLATMGSGSSLCLIVAICQGDYYGISVMCRGTPPLLTNVVVLLTNVLGLLQIDKILALQAVSQSPANCIFPSLNCPA